MTHTDDHSFLLSTTSLFTRNPLLRRLLYSDTSVSVSPPTMSPIASPNLLVRRLLFPVNYTQRPFVCRHSFTHHLMIRSYWYVPSADPSSVTYPCSQRRVVKCPKNKDTIYRRHSVGCSTSPSVLSAHPYFLATTKDEETIYRRRFVPHHSVTLLAHFGAVFNRRHGISSSLYHPPRFCMRRLLRGLILCPQTTKTPPIDAVLFPHPPRASWHRFQRSFCLENDEDTTYRARFTTPSAISLSAPKQRRHDVSSPFCSLSCRHLSAHLGTVFLSRR